MTSVVFSVEPSTSDNGCFVPSMSMPRATTHICSPKCTPQAVQSVPRVQAGGQKYLRFGLSYRDVEGHCCIDRSAHSISPHLPRQMPCSRARLEAPRVSCTPGYVCGAAGVAASVAA